jgi:hypothetical protein
VIIYSTVRQNLVISRELFKAFIIYFIVAHMFYLHQKTAWKQKEKVYKFPKLEICRLSQLSGISLEQAKEVAIELNANPDDEELVHALRLGKYISDMNQKYNCTVGCFPPNTWNYVEAMYDIADSQGVELTDISDLL